MLAKDTASGAIFGFMRRRARVVVFFGVVGACALVALAAAAGIVTTNGLDVSALVSRARSLESSLGLGGSARAIIIIVAWLAIEIVVVGWYKSSAFRLLVRRSRSSLIDTVFYASGLIGLVTVLQIVFTLGASVGAASVVNWATEHLGSYRLTLPSGNIAAIAFSFSVYYLSTTFIAYWGHRLMHLRHFWHIHRFHHAATELNMLTCFRMHPLEPVILGFLTVASPLTFLKVPNEVLLVYFVWGTTFELLAHSELRWSYGWFGRWVAASPVVHQVHHSLDAEHQDLNFCPCPLWDHLFGTWYHGPNAPTAYGIVDPAYERRPVTQIARDVWIFYVLWAQQLSAPIRRLMIRKIDAPVNEFAGHGTIVRSDR